MDPGKLTKDLITDESIQLKPYLDCGHSAALVCTICHKGLLTIGIGRNLAHKGIARDEAFYLADHDIESAVADLDAKLPWWRSLSEPRQRVLANMMFNMGPQRISTFKNFLHFTETGQYSIAASEMRSSLWAKQTGPRAKRLATMMETGLEPVGVV